MFKKGDMIESNYRGSHNFRYKVLDTFKENNTEMYLLENVQSGVQFRVSQNNADILCVKVSEYNG
jgi:hypothetical protein